VPPPLGTRVFPLQALPSRACLIKEWVGNGCRINGNRRSNVWLLWPFDSETDPSCGKVSAERPEPVMPVLGTLLCSSPFQCSSMSKLRKLCGLRSWRRHVLSPQSPSLGQLSPATVSTTHRHIGTAVSSQSMAWCWTVDAERGGSSSRLCSMASPSETLREPTAKLIMVMIWTCRRATEIDDVRKLLLEIFFFVCLSELPCSFYKKASREYEIRSHGDWRVPLSFSKHNSIACIPCVLTRRSVVHLTGALLPFWSTYSCCTRAPERYMFDHNHALISQGNWRSEKNGIDVVWGWMHAFIILLSFHPFLIAWTCLRSWHFRAGWRFSSSSEHKNKNRYILALKGQMQAGAVDVSCSLASTLYIILHRNNNLATVALYHSYTLAFSDLYSMEWE
jgi:hypothetical protein